MARDQDMKALRNEEIRAEYERLRAKRNKHGELVHHPESIIGQIARQHFLSKRTVEDVIYSR